MNRYIAIAVGGSLGTLARYAVGLFFARHVALDFPLATLAVNLSGSFLLGLLLTLAADALPIHPTLRLAATVGFLGAYTTFSTFEYETMSLAEHGRLAATLLYVVASVLLGLAAVWSGAAIGRAMVR